MRAFRVIPRSLPLHHFVVGTMPQPAAIARARNILLRFQLDLFLAVTLLLLIGVPQILFLFYPVAGVYATSVSFVVLTAVAAGLRRVRKVAIAASILPLAFMVSWSLPQSVPFAQSLVFYGTMLLLGMVYRYLFTLEEPVKETRLGPKGYMFGLPLLVVGGQVLGAAGFGLLHNQYPFVETAWWLVAAGAVLFAIAEETVFRGLIQQRARYLIHPWLAVILSAGLYALVTVGQGNTLATIFAVIAGFTLSITYHFKKNLLLTITMNAAAKLLYIGLLATFVFR